MEWWSRMMSPVRLVWIRLATRLGMPRSGLTQLRKEVSTCEYQDVHVMWEILQKTTTDIDKNRNDDGRMTTKRNRNRIRRNSWAGVLGWAPHNLCRSF